MIFNDVELAYGKDSCRALSTLPCIPVDYFCQATPCCNEECVYAVSFPLESSALRQRQSTENIFTCIWRDCVYCLSSSLSFFCFKIITLVYQFEHFTCWCSGVYMMGNLITIFWKNTGQICIIIIFFLFFLMYVGIFLCHQYLCHYCV